MEEDALQTGQPSEEVEASEAVTEAPTTSIPGDTNDVVASEISKAESQTLLAYEELKLQFQGVSEELIERDETVQGLENQIQDLEARPDVAPTDVGRELSDARHLIKMYASGNNNSKPARDFIKLYPTVVGK